MCGVNSVTKQDAVHTTMYDKGHYPETQNAKCSWLGSR